MFFTDDKSRLFSPLAGKFREQALGCLTTLYDRLHGPEADYEAHVSRDDVRDLFLQVIRKTPVLGDAPEGDQEGHDSRDEVTHANWMRRNLAECGWIEEVQDKGAMLTTYRFTRIGKLLAERIVEIASPGLRSRQRNVRSALRALASFAADGEPHDLIDALDFAKRVISDLSDEVADFYERRRRMMVEASSMAANSVLEDLLDYFEKRFRPDHAIRLQADSVERHRDRIRAVCSDIRAWSAVRFARADERLMTLHPALGEKGGSPTLRLVDQVEQYVDAACTTKMPEFRAALNAYVNRSHTILRHAIALSLLGQRSVASLLKRFSRLDATAQDAVFESIAERLTPFSPQLPDPDRIRLRERVSHRMVMETTPEIEPTREELLEAALQHAEEEAFAVTLDGVLAHVVANLDGSERITTAMLPVTDAPSLLAQSHAIEAGAVGVTVNNIRVRVHEPDAPADYETPYLRGKTFVLEREGE